MNILISLCGVLLVLFLFFLLTLFIFFFWFKQKKKEEEEYLKSLSLKETLSEEIQKK